MEPNVRFVVVLLSLVGSAMLGCSSESNSQSLTKANPGNSDRNTNEKPRPFAVVELFTSEGCSSCPPADKLLASISERAEHNDRRVFPLAFHVTYWDRLGWTDPFGEKVYSRRQRNYARAFDRDRVYTPQMVVNGQAEFVGSNRTQARRAISDALDATPPAAVRIDEVSMKAGSDGSHGMDVNYSLAGDTDGYQLNLAVTEDGLSSDVARGENRGRTLRHDGVVRVFKQIDPTSGRARLKIPDQVALENAALIIYLEAGKSMEIHGADRVNLSQAAQRVAVGTQHP